DFGTAGSVVGPIHRRESMLRLVAVNRYQCWLEVSHGRRRTAGHGSPVAAGDAEKGQVLAIVVAAQWARRAHAAESGSRRPRRRAERRSVGRSGPGAHWSHVAVAIRVLPRHGRGHGSRLSGGCGDRAASGLLRRRAYLQFRTVRLAGTPAAVRPQRF